MAFVVSTAIRLDLGTSSSDYIQLHSGDKAALAESLGLCNEQRRDYRLFCPKIRRQQSE